MSLKSGKPYHRTRILVSIIILFVALSGVVNASADTVPGDFSTVFEKNLNALNDPDFWNDPGIYTGRFSFNGNADFAKEFQKHTLFGELQPSATAYFRYLNELTISEKQSLVKRFSYYRSLLEKQLKAAGFAEELKYLAPALSAMNFHAAGKNKQAGVWQLTHFQGVLNGLMVNRLVDERLNVEEATKAVVSQFKRNVELFGSTEMAVIAYLSGNTKLRNVLARCGENQSTEQVLKYMPEVSEIIAGYQAMTVFLGENTFEPDEETVLPDLVSVNRQLHFHQISQVMNISEKQLQFLNPQYRHFIVPGNERPMTLRIPAGKYDEFVLWTDSIYNAYDSTFFQVVAQKIEYPPAPNRQFVGEKVKDLEIEGKTKIKYTIKSGDVLGFIAEDYNVRVADLKYWNNIYNERRIQAGKTLDIFVDDENADYYRNLQKRTITTTTKNVGMQETKTSSVPVYKVPDSAKKVEYVVKNGESPYVIAKRYDGVTPEAILEWNGITDARKIQIGQKLIIYLVQ
ncbi:LysM peptidoglycan-binding domain-containing protein [Prolixibacteraceae bacterium Z1-6]|uniref:LysM peptidoglycan-binding domain-containing protein n=1 Tax=Draconibacterium aestuarii TaxID=2998507 RepID=A0A9X3F2N3_9BACT|nr:LysM peptidoglycan-binding domain-containing protein [Prolixibacteraceae bacterium Z1-6]